MTKRQRHILKYLSENPGCYLRHQKTQRGFCYRLLDDKFNPVAKIQFRTIKRLLQFAKISVNADTSRVTVLL